MTKLKEFLQDSNGCLSSKRLGFLTALLVAIITTLLTLGVLLLNDKFILAIDLVDSVWLATFGFSGVVASEFFRRRK